MNDRWLGGGQLKSVGSPKAFHETVDVGRIVNIAHQAEELAIVPEDHVFEVVSLTRSKKLLSKQLLDKNETFLNELFVTDS